MSKRILIAMDDSENALRAVREVAETFTPESQVTLFSVLPDTAALCEMNSPELTAYFQSQQVVFCALQDQKKRVIEAALERARQELVAAGFDAGRIVLKAQQRKHGVARDIVAEARQGYDLIVIGRRGMSGIQEFFLGSVSQKVLHAAQDISVLMVN
jgi:nucleotide-binding universal stress UspA family protein